MEGVLLVNLSLAGSQTVGFCPRVFNYCISINNVLKLTFLRFIHVKSMFTCFGFLVELSHEAFYLRCCVAIYCVHSFERK